MLRGSLTYHHISSDCLAHKKLLAPACSNLLRHTSDSIAKLIAFTSIDATRSSLSGNTCFSLPSSCRSSERQCSEMSLQSDCIRITARLTPSRALSSFASAAGVATASTVEGTGLDEDAEAAAPSLNGRANHPHTQSVMHASYFKYIAATKAALTPKAHRYDRKRLSLAALQKSLCVSKIACNMFNSGNISSQDHEEGQ